MIRTEKKSQEKWFLQLRHECKIIRALFADVTEDFV
jgi:hypothetical protein